MQKNHIFCIIFFIYLFSCSENGEPSILYPSKPTKASKEFLPNVLYQEGKMLFNTHCKSCHPISGKVCPQLLANLNEKWRDKQVLYAFIRNSQAVIAKDAYAKALYEACNKAAMPAFLQLTDKQIDLMLGYVAQTLSPDKRDW